MSKDNYAIDCLIQKAIQYLQSNDFIKGEEELKHAILLNPSSCIVHNLLGVAKELAGDDILARKYYRVANEFDPTYQPAIHNLERITSFHYTARNLDFGDVKKRSY